MGALGVSQGKRFRLHPPAMDFARHHSVEIKACQAGDAKRKGKVERPIRDLKEGFLTELDALGAPTSVAELNCRGELWLATRVHGRAHATTGEPPAARLEVERRFLGRMPARRFDTAYREDRRVHPRLPLVEWDGVAYSVPPEAVGSKVACRVEVDSDQLEGVVGHHGRRPSPPRAGGDRAGVGPGAPGRGGGRRPWAAPPGAPCPHRAGW